MLVLALPPRFCHKQQEKSFKWQQKKNAKQSVRSLERKQFSSVCLSVIGNLCLTVWSSLCKTVLNFSTDPKRGPNCKMSDILQRDLLPNVDYVPDSDAWLFAWDNYNPECRAVANEPVHNNVGYKEDRQHYDGILMRFVLIN
jgi:hypothetical protein